MKISRDELRQKFIDFKKQISWSGVTFAFVEYITNEYGSKTKTVTDANGKKTKEYALQKRVLTQITVGSDYESKVQRIQKKQDEKPDFKAGELIGKFYKYGKAVPIVANTKNPEFEMLVMIFENHTKPKVELLCKGKEITEEDAIKQDLFTPSYFAEKTTAGRGEVNPEFDFAYRTLGFDKIVKLNIAGEEYIIEN